MTMDFVTVETATRVFTVDRLKLLLRSNGVITGSPAECRVPSGLFLRLIDAVGEHVRIERQFSGRVGGGGQGEVRDY